MATLNKVRAPRIVKPDASNRQVLDSTYRILNGQSWTAGDFLTVDTAGLLKVASIATNTLAEVGGMRFYANETVTNPGNNTTFASVTVITSDMEFEGNVMYDANTNATALATTNLVGQQHGLIRTDADGNSNTETYVAVYSNATAFDPTNQPLGLHHFLRHQLPP